MKIKVCDKCCNDLPEIYFELDKSTNDGLSQECRECEEKENRNGRRKKRFEFNGQW